MYTPLGPVTSMFLFLGIASLAFFSFLAVASWSSARRKEREAYYKSETFKKIAESQSPAAASVLEALREQEKADARRIREGIKLSGVVTAAAGIGIMPLLRGVEPNEPVYLAGLIPLLIGLAMLAYLFFLAPKTER